jgi:predicted  nucleic acid-binding Zn-ribbon protein
MNNKVYLAIIAALVFVCAFLGYKVSQKSTTIMQQTDQIETLDIERDRLEIDLMKMRISYDTLKTDNAQLRTEIEAQKQEIDEMLKKIKDKNYNIAKLQKETETLRSIMKGYVVQIDSLNTLNQQLMAENQNIKAEASNIKKENQDLVKRQENMEKVISTGKTLVSGNIVSQGVKLRSSGKQVEVDRAKSTEMIKTCFTIYENPISDPGTKFIYLRIIGPDGEVLPAPGPDAMAKLEGEMQAYSIKREIDYTNEELDVCVFYTMQSEAKKGVYKIFIYEDGKRIGVNDLTLK